MALSPSASYPPSPMSLELLFFPADLQELIPVTESLPVPEPAVPSLSFFFFLDGVGLAFGLALGLGFALGLGLGFALVPFLDPFFFGE